MAKLIHALSTRRRKLLLAAMAVFFVLIVAPYSISRVRSVGRQIRVGNNAASATVSVEPVTSLRVLTYNIAHGRGTTDDNWEGTTAEKRQRIDQIAQLIRQARADVVILNEVDFDSTWSGHQNQAEAIALRARFPYWVEQRNFDLRFVYGSWKFGNAILSRFPIADAEMVPFPALRPMEQTLAGCKQGVVCTLQLSQTQQIRVMAVHLEHRSEDTRVASAAKIIETGDSSDVPLLAVGDFNSTPSTFPDSERSVQGENALDRLILCRQFQIDAEKTPTEKEMTFPTNTPARVIDWILIPAGWRFTGYRTISWQLSDHRPVVADVQLPVAVPEQKAGTSEAQFRQAFLAS